MLIRPPYLPKNSGHIIFIFFLFKNIHKYDYIYTCGYIWEVAIGKREK